MKINVNRDYELYHVSKKKEEFDERFHFHIFDVCGKRKKKKSGINAGRMEEGASDIYSKLGGWCTEHGQAPS